MSASIGALTDAVEAAPHASSGNAAPRISGEHTFVGAALLLMVLIPMAEAVCRAAGADGISGSSTIVQHLTLVVSMLGAALAARDRRLLSLATGELLRGRLRAVASLYSDVVAGASQTCIGRPVCFSTKAPSHMSGPKRISVSAPWVRRMCSTTWTALDEVQQ